MWSSEPREGLAACSAKEVPSFLSYFKTLSNGPAPEIEPATSRSAVKCSTDWANPATVDIVQLCNKFELKIVGKSYPQVRPSYTLCVKILLWQGVWNRYKVVACHLWVTLLVCCRAGDHKLFLLWLLSWLRKPIWFGWSILPSVPPTRHWDCYNKGVQTSWFLE